MNGNRGWYNTSTAPADGSAIFDEGTLSPGGQWTPNGPMAGAAQITTSITPRPLYSAGLTQRTTNQAVADGQRSANKVHAQKQFDRAGVSRGAASRYRAAPTVARGLTEAAMAGGQIPWADEAANQQFMLQGQVARAGEFNQLADLLQKLQGLSNYSNQQNMAALAPLFGIFGGLANG